MKPYRPIKTIRTDTTLDLSQKAEKSDWIRDFIFCTIESLAEKHKPQENKYFGSMFIIN